ncbi:hypothetical protein NBRC116594_07200 [Shimia sp. NS0008-38b]|uniref:winged helix-turn-helix transcriptional regulator n=1 Tax=Shimia sp. NS0008-38b TaxID=3127653 RepID=UPI00310C5EB0
MAMANRDGLELVGDRSTLVILRNLVNGKAKIADFLAGPEKITTNIWASRLSQMEDNALVIKQPYQSNPPRHSY